MKRGSTRAATRACPRPEWPDSFMTCRKCKSPMVELAHIAHGMRKFRCPACGAHRMQQAKIRKDRKRKAPLAARHAPDVD